MNKVEFARAAKMSFAERYDNFIGLGTLREGRRIVGFTRSPVSFRHVDRPPGC